MNIFSYVNTLKFVFLVAPIIPAYATNSAFHP